MPTLAIVIPTKNEEDYLPKLLASIAEQTLRPEVVIVADANSTDSTRQVALEHGATVVEGGMPGPGRNRGAQSVESDLIFFFDADVVLTDPEFLRRAVEEFTQRELAVATADVEAIDGNRADAWGHRFYNRYVRLWGATRPHAPGFCILARRSVHERINGFDESVLFCEDHDYVFRAGQIGRFGFLSPSITIPVSTRRLARDGRLNIAVKFILAELHLLLVGPIRHNGFKYSFGHSKRRD